MAAREVSGNQGEVMGKEGGGEKEMPEIHSISLDDDSVLYLSSNWSVGVAENGDRNAPSTDKILIDEEQKLRDHLPPLDI